MHISRFSDLTLRILMYLGSRARPMEATVTVRAAAEMFNVPYNHMVKVAHQLGVRGLLVTTKGHGGGLRLARAPESIRLGDILRMSEADHSVVDCVAQACPLCGDCLLKSALDSAHSAFLERLNEFTLAQVARTPGLQSLVHLQ